jgi:hypothetical protein
MKNPAQQWLAARALPTGMLACGVRRPDGKFFCRNVAENCPPEKVEGILGAFAGLPASWFSAPHAPQWSTWVFEHGQIRLVERPDGWRLAAVVNAEADPRAGLDALSQEFLGLQLDA